MDGWGRVIAAVIDRRSELGWTQKQLAAVAGVAERTIQNLEAGKRPLPVNRGKIERALGWNPGEFRRIEGAGPSALIPEDNWERAILADPTLSDREKRTMITRSRKIRNEMYPAARSALAAADENDDQQDPGAAAS